MIKYLFLLGLFCILSSCSSEELSQISKENSVEFKQSAAMRSTFEAIKNTALTKSSSKATKAAEALCFQFVYPITLKYSTDETVVVANYNDLLKILQNETLDRHINAIGFPFDVEARNNGTQQSITNESDFKTLIEGCGYETIDYTKVVEFVGQCFTINYPIALVVNDAILSFNSEQEAKDYFTANYTTVKTVTVSYPFSVILLTSDNTEVIDDDFEFITLINDTCGIN